MKQRFEINQTIVEADVVHLDGMLHITIGDQTYRFKRGNNNNLLSVLENESTSHAITASPKNTKGVMHISTHTIDAWIKPLKAASATEGTDSEKVPTAPMPGIIQSIHVNAGDSLKKGDTILVMEAMKMQISIDTPYDAVIDKIHVNPGQQVPEGMELVELTKIVS